MQAAPTVPKTSALPGCAIPRLSYNLLKTNTFQRYTDTTPELHIRETKRKLGRERMRKVPRFSRGSREGSFRMCFQGFDRRQCMPRPAPSVIDKLPIIRPRARPEPASSPAMSRRSAKQIHANRASPQRLANKHSPEARSNVEHA